jgi:hypothetical protein
MRESIFKGFFVNLLLLMIAGWCSAGEETVDDVLARAQNVYVASNGVTVQAYQRQVWISAREMPAGQSHFGPPPLYSVLTLRKKNPDDWYVANWGFTGIVSPSGSTMPARPPSGFLLVKRGVNPGKLSSFGGTDSKVSAENSLTDDEFAQSLRSRLLNNTNVFSALEPLVDGPSKDFMRVPFGLKDARLVGAETWQGHDVYRVEGTGSMGGPAVAWIDQKTGLILRMVVQRGMSAGPYRTMIETLYDTKLNAKLVAIDFDSQPPAASSDAMSEDQMGFGPADDLKQYSGNAVGGSAGRFSPSATPAAYIATPSSAPEQQALSAEQMEGIVLIDGDEGTATGFMTQIKGVDFVVTNQHVLGSNKKITLKNLHGEEVPVLGIFGAVGSDIAILKISKAQGALKLASDVLKSVKIGDKIVVVGNRLGGGVATQTSGLVLGVGPTRIEVNANFEPGNSGSPIFSTSTNEVVGVATYAETRKVSVEEGYSSSGSSSAAKVDKRWFGYRIDGITKWEAIDLARWHAQSARIEQFRDMSEALVAVIRLKLGTAAENKRLAPIIADFQSRMEQRGGNRAAVADDVKSFFYPIRNIAESGIREFEAGDYYDYYRTSLYWENSIPMQVDYRKAIVDVLKKYEANSVGYVSRMRNGGN